MSQDTATAKKRLDAATCSASLVIDVLRGPDVAVGTRAIDSNIQSSKHGINWTKTRRHLESALRAAKQGNVVQVTILMQRTSLPNNAITQPHEI